MKSTQWLILGFAFLLLGIIFIQQDSLSGLGCKMSSELDKSTLVACIQGEIFEPFIWSFGILFFVCLINGWLAEKGKEND